MVTMNQNMHLIGTFLLRLFRKGWARALAGCVLLATFILIALPYGLKEGLQYWLLQNGADTVRIADVSLNPFLGRLGIENMLVESNGKKVLANSKFAIDLSLAGLLTKKVRVEKAVYDNITLDIEQLADGRWRITSYTTPLGTVDSPQQGTSSPWHFYAEEMLFHDCLVQLHLPDLQIALQINAAELKKVTNLPDGGAGSFVFKGIVNEAPVELTIDTLALTPQLSLAGSLKTQGIHLKQFTKLLAPHVQSLEGAVDADGRFALMMPQAALPRFSFDGQLSLSNPAMQRPDFVAAGKKVAWQGTLALNGEDASNKILHLNGTFAGTELAVDKPGQTVAIKAKEFKVSGPVQCSLGKEAQVTSQAGVAVTGAMVSLPASTLSFNAFSWQGEAGYAAGAHHVINTSGTMKIGDLAVTSGQRNEPASKASQAAAVSVKAIDWAGKAAYSQDTTSTITVDGQLKTGGTTLTLPSQQLWIEQENGQIDTQGSMAVKGENQPQIKGKGKIAFTQTKAIHLDDALPIGSLASLKAELTASEEAPVKADALVLLDLAVQIPDPLPLTINIPQTTISGLLAKSWPHLGADALTSTDIQTTSRQTQAEIASLRQLRLEKLQFNPELGASTAGLQLDELTIFPAKEKNTPPPIVQMKQGRSNLLQWSQEKGLHIEEVLLNDLRLNMLRGQDGQLQLNQQLAALQTAPPPQAQQDTVPGTPGKNNPGQNITVKTLRVQGKSALHFDDRSLAEPFTGEADIQQLELTNLSTANPDQPAKITLQALLAQRAPLAVTGALKPFLPKPEVDGRISLKNYPLVRLSPYTVQSVGLALASGQLNLQSTLEVGEGQINMKNGVVLKKIETKTIAGDLAKKLDNQLPLPLDTAISFLKDSNDDISLDIPVRGPLAKLDVGIGDILITALGKAIVPAASSYLMYALGPYGALAYVGLKVGEKIMRASLAPVIFPPLDKTLTPEHVAYLERVASILRERPTLEVNFCPIAPTWELEAGQTVKKTGSNQQLSDEAAHQQLVQLGQERAQAVISHLVAQYNIEQSRLMICETVVTEEKKAVPEVELQL